MHQPLSRERYLLKCAGWQVVAYMKVSIAYILKYIVLPEFQHRQP